MKLKKKLWLVFITLFILINTLEARSRRRMNKEKQLQSDEPNPEQNQQPDDSYDDYRIDTYDYDGYEDSDEETNRRSEYCITLLSTNIFNIKLIIL